jgi:hypothetical protein
MPRTASWLPMTRLGTGPLAAFAALILVAGCAASSAPATSPSALSQSPAASPSPVASPSPAASPSATVQAAPHETVKVLAREYLAIAVPANRRLDTEEDGFTDDERDDLAAAVADLRAQVRTERRFDQRLLKIPFPPRIDALARALVLVNQGRIAITNQQARSTSLTALRSADPLRQAADASVEAAAKLLRRALGLPPPSDS